MQRYFAKEKMEDNMVLESGDYFHIKRVMRMQEGDKIEVVYQGKLYLCCLVNVNQNMEIKVLEMVDEMDQRQKEIILVIPILKEQKMDFILQKATELGVSKIIPVRMERCVVKVNEEKEEKKLERWMKICKEASEQSMRLQIPTITPLMTLDELDRLSGLKLLCSTREKQKKLRFFLQSLKEYDKIIIVVGPEGGLSKEEEDRLIEGGFVPVSLGNRIMRVETVPLFFLSVLDYELME